MPKRTLNAEDAQDAATSACKRGKESLSGETPLNDPSKNMENNDYTVGWICALSTEHVAARAFLDEKYDRPDCVSRNDNNIYTLGRIGKHKIVIAVLPDGEYGTAAAAGVARDMLHSFPNIRFGLMVGIAGGAPSIKHDIRLGDVVVSASRAGKGGVFQYDFGKTIQNQVFQTTGLLNQPPVLLRAAVGDIKAEHEEDGHRLEYAINTVLEKRPRLRKKYRRPDKSSDRLYQSGFTHPPHDESGCSITCNKDLSNQVLRAERSEEDENPAIHYGVIASANQLMKDALVRDKLATEKDVLCFEMEAAGLMNQFPCLVIRGICDYSDSHKSKEWQGYAAMTAAAYAKDLLRRIPPDKVEAEKRVTDILSGVQKDISVLLGIQQDQERETILNWLTPIDYTSQQHDFISRRQEGTGQWLLESLEFQKFVEADQQTLYCPGIPGAGKTILTSIVVEDLHKRFGNDRSVGIAYLYCNFKRSYEQRLDDLLLSLIKQLARQHLLIPEAVTSLYKSCKLQQMRPSTDEILKMLYSVISNLSSVYIITDALDECQVDDQCRSRLISEIFNLQVRYRVKFFATSRSIREITDRFKSDAWLEIRATDDDLRRYLHGRMARLPNCVSTSSDLQEKIKDAIVKSVNGMFLLAQLHLDSLVDKTTPKKIARALEELPIGSKSLDLAYEKAIQRIQGQEPGFVELAWRVISWITCAKRPLTSTELQHALAVEPSDIELCEDNLEDIDEMVSSCAGLVTVDREGDIVRLIHHTTQRYFEQTQSRWFPNAETDIAITCVTYLSFTPFQRGRCKTDHKYEKRLQLHKLYHYAAHQWGHHARNGLDSYREVARFLREKAQVEAASQVLMAVKRSSTHIEYSQQMPEKVTGLHLAAYFGIYEAAELLVGTENPNARDGYGRTPLSWAAEHGQEAIVRLLLGSDKVEVDAKDRNHETPLFWAAQYGDEAIVKLLLDTRKVNVDGRDIHSQTPLLCAAKRGHEAVVKLLLDTGKVEVDAQGENGQTPLSWAAKFGHSAVVQLLLNSGKAEVDAKDRCGQTPLSWAAEHGHKAVVKLFLDSGKADADAADIYGRTPLLLAAQNGYEAIGKLLLDSGKVNADAKDNIYSQTPLSWAAQGGYEAVVKLLLDTGKVVVDGKDHLFGQTPLSWAAQHGHEAVVKLLLDTGEVEVDGKNTYGQTPLSLAADNGYVAVVKLLLNISDAEVNTKYISEQTWTSLTTKKPRKAYETLASESVRRQTPLMRAVKKGRKAVISLLRNASKNNNAGKNNADVLNV